MPTQKIIETDPKVLKFLRDRGFKPFDYMENRTNLDRRVYNITCTLSDGDRLSGHLTYDYNDEKGLPNSVRIWPDGKFARRVRLVGKYKWLVYFDEAIAACTSILRISKKVSASDHKIMQRHAELLLNNPKY